MTELIKELIVNHFTKTISIIALLGIFLILSLGEISEWFNKKK
jgi:hypothetical protein